MNNTSNALLAYAVELQNANRWQLGFLPTVTFAKALEERRLRFQEHGSQIAGYLLHGRPKTSRVVHVYQAVVETDARRLKAATAMVKSLIADCQAASVATISLRCAEDLDAMEFWQSLGFRPVRYELPTSKTNRRLIRLELDILPRLFTLSTPDYCEKMSAVVTSAVKAVPRYRRK